MDLRPKFPATAIKGRGALSNPHPRFLRRRVENDAPQAELPIDGDLPPRHPATRLRIDASRSIIARNNSPDLHFTQSINPYRGCEHGCVYCYARPTHAYLDLSPGLDFETQLFYKPDAARLLDAELRRPGYRCSAITLGANTDPYQPAERELGITRSLLEKLLEFRHPVNIITKGASVLHDLDLLQELAAQGLVSIMVSLITLDNDLKRTLEPRAAAPVARLRIIRELTEAGVPVGVLVAPVIPAVNDSELEQIIAAVAEAGARSAAYIPLRLPHEVSELFRQWLQTHLPLRAAHVMSLVNDLRGGRDNDPRFGHRMRGQGPYAELLRKRFAQACRKHGLERGERLPVDTSKFRVPGAQRDLWETD
jgi:DNA repair photolyase